MAALVIGGIGLAGCSATTLEGYLGAESGMAVGTGRAHPTYDALAAGKLHFANDNWGLAEENFRRAVEVGPANAEAWIGLAASYDRLRRFDLADRAYEHAIKLVGHNAVVLNNLGYSYLLRGDVQQARRHFLLAHDKAPQDPAILNNLLLLDTSTQYIKGE